MDIKEIEKFLNESEEGKQWLQSRIDSHVSKGVSTFKSKFEKEELPKILDSEVKKRYPEATEEQKRLKEIELKLEQAERSRHKAELSSQLIRYAQERNIPQFLVDVSIDADYDTSLQKLNTHYKTFNDQLSSEVEKRIESRKNPIRQFDDSTPIDLANLPKDDPDFYVKNHNRLEELLRKNAN